MSHQHSGSCGCAEAAKAADAISTSLFPSIDLSRVRCFNEAEHDMGRHCLKPWDQRNDARRTLSDPDDGELLLHIPFTSAVHIRSLALMAWGDWRPVRVRLFVNRDDLDLSSAPDAACAQEVQLNDDTEGWLDYPLKQAKFQNVSSLQLLVTEAVGGGQSGIQFLHLKGAATDNKRQIVNVVYESRANPADHNKLKEENAASQAAN